LQNYKVNFDAIPWEHPLPGARFKAYERDGKKLRLVEFTSELVEPDWCLKGHIGYVVSGSMDINFNGKTVSFKQGDGIFIPAGEDNRHMVTRVHNTVCLLLIEDA
jgi:ethanolamine utilization protein EutQ (cupin superfamily)